MVIMTFCLMIYNVAQGILREKLTQTQQKIPNQLGKPIQTPTLRWIFQIMEGVCRVTISDKAEVVKIQTTNMTSLRVLIVKLFGPTCQEIYGLI